MCESCKLNYRKYGDENGERIPEYLFRPVEPASTYQRPLPKRKLKGEDGAEGEEVLPTDANIEGRNSPGASSTSSNTSTSRVSGMLYVISVYYHQYMFVLFTSSYSSLCYDDVHQLFFFF